jgi:hypothetical protein
MVALNPFQLLARGDSRVLLTVDCCTTTRPSCIGVRPTRLPSAPNHQTQLNRPEHSPCMLPPQEVLVEVPFHHHRFIFIILLSLITSPTVWNVVHPIERKWDSRPFFPFSVSLWHPSRASCQCQDMVKFRQQSLGPYLAKKLSFPPVFIGSVNRLRISSWRAYLG